MKKYGVSVTTENEEQFKAAAESGAAEAVYADIRYILPETYPELAAAAHEKGIKAGLRLPAVSNGRVKEFISENRVLIRESGFDMFLFGNMESIADFAECDILEGSSEINIDHSIYITNSEAFLMLREMLEHIGIGTECRAGNKPDMASGPALRFVTYPLELSRKELGDIDISCKRELVVYGRVPMMTSAQCVKKTASGCSRTPETLYLHDRTGAVMPVKNCCRFCFNTVYNSVPTMLYDLEAETDRLFPDRLRYDFTVETLEEVKAVLGGKILPQGGFTRGHFKKGVL